METQYDFNKNLVGYLEKFFPKHRDFVKFLIDNLDLSYEAAYRRTKCEVSFTLREIIVIAKKMQISIDSLVNFSSKKGTRFDMNVVVDENNNDYLSHYTAVLIEPCENFATRCQSGKVLSSKAVHADLPPIFLFPYRYLTRFNIFTWAYELYPDSLKEGFAGLQLPDDILRRQDRIYDIMTSCKHNTSVIFGHNIITSFVKRVLFFKNLGIISFQDLACIKQELLAAIDNLEEIVKTGKYSKGNPVEIFLADIDIGTSYLCIKTDLSEYTIIDLYKYHTLLSDDEYIIKMHQKWEMSLKKYSTLLNQSSDVIRSGFFRQQREYIERNI